MPARFWVVLLSVATAISLAFLEPGNAGAAAIITNGTVTLGVNNEGDLNVTEATLPGFTTLPNYPGPSLTGTLEVGLRFNPMNADATAPGCLCEGWGVAIVNAPGGPFSGFVNRAFTQTPVVNISPVSFSSTANTATSVVNINGVSNTPALQITHTFSPSASPNLYQVGVTIRNISGATLGSGPRDLLYRRVMDWDIEPTPASEFVTIGGLPATNLLFSSNNGFEVADPLVNTPSQVIDCTTTPTDCGPSDHGAQFDFGFPALADGEERIFSIFYGAAATEADADLARAVAGVEPFSYGQCDAEQELIPTCGQGIGAPANAIPGTPNTFIFGFAGVGGTPPPPPPPPPTVPAPSTVLLLGSGLIGLVVARRLMK